MRRGPTGDGTTRTYLLTGVLRCAWCHRRMDARCVNGWPGYRCRHGHTSATGRPVNDAGVLYIREDYALARFTTELGHPVGELNELVNYRRAAEITVTCNEPGTGTRRRP